MPTMRSSARRARDAISGWITTALAGLVAFDQFRENPVSDPQLLISKNHALRADLTVRAGHSSPTKRRSQDLDH
jgi:hypothetical protein